MGPTPTRSEAERVRDAARGFLDAARLGVPMAPFTGGLTFRRDLVGEPTDDTPSPMLQMLGGTKAWQRAVRLKVYLLLLWARSNALPDRDEDPYVPVVAHEVAAVLGLADPKGSGASDVNEAIRRLAELGYLETVPDRMRRGRRHPFVKVLDESGTGAEHHRTDRRVTRLGNAFVTGGWLAHLDGAALAALLVFTTQAQAHRLEEPFLWLPASGPEAKSRYYGVTSSTLNKGCKSLCRAGLMRHRSFRPPNPVPGHTYPVGFHLVGTVPWVAGYNRFPEERRRAAAPLRARLSTPFGGNAVQRHDDDWMVEAFPGLADDDDWEVRPAGPSRVRDSDEQLLPDADIGGTRDPAVIAALKAWRAARSTADDKPPYIYLTDSLIDAIATRRPDTLFAMRTVPGMGPRKLSAYGEEILEVLRSVEAAPSTAHPPTQF